MADIKDVSTIIASSLNEVGVSGTLAVHMDGEQVAGLIGEDDAEQVEVVVTVVPAGGAEGKAE